MCGTKKEKFYSKPIKLSLLFRKQIKAKVFIILWDGMVENYLSVHVLIGSTEILCCESCTEV